MRQRDQQEEGAAQEAGEDADGKQSVDAGLGGEFSAGCVGDGLA